MNERYRRKALVLALTIAACVFSGVWLAGVDSAKLFHPLTLLLAGFAFITNLTSARWNASLELSGSLVAALTAVTFVGPGAGLFVVVVAEGLAWGVERLRLVALPLNVLAIGAPVVAAGLLLSRLFPDGPDGEPLFYLVFGLSAALASLVNLAIIAVGHLAHDGTSLRVPANALRQLGVAWCLNIAVAVAVAAVYGTVGLSAVALLLLGFLAFTYQSHLVARAEERARSHASLSWGVLSGMLRSLDMRDSRAAKHSAAVARYARDIAAVAGLPKRDQELAHTAGLLHDVGKFALSDRVMERGVGLTDSDWRGIRRHPDLGADMLKDLGHYGPIAEIVRSHHERLDGRGYPDGRSGDEIHEIAKIVAVAEVYDALTADNSYRATMSSFEALRELRRVSGSQLESRFVEALAEGLAGKDVGYRHASAADFDRELALERRIGEAVHAGAGEA